MALDIKTKEKLSAEIADMNVKKIQDLKPKKSFQTFALSSKCSSRVQGIISFLNTADGKPYLKGQL